MIFLLISQTVFLTPMVHVVITAAEEVITVAVAVAVVEAAVEIRAIQTVGISIHPQRHLHPLITPHQFNDSRLATSEHY